MTDNEDTQVQKAEPKKRGPKTKKRDLEKDLDKLQLCVAKMAHFSGNQRILDEFNIPRWEPGKKDMTRWN